MRSAKPGNHLKELRVVGALKRGGGGGGDCITGMAFFTVFLSLVVFVERSLKTERVWDFS